jgi:hypothetical protein
VRLELHPEARAELRSAALWYDERQPGLGDEFISEVAASLKRFPFVIAFELHEQHVLVLAVAHAKRRPLYWLTRAEP